jgi:myo-inositol-1(or 4)-monophosphatase
VFWASRGAGAWHNDRRLSVSTTQSPQRALIGTGFPFKDTSQAERYIRQLAALIPLVSGMRRAGSAALDLCDVGAGRFDGFWEQQLAPWDLAAGVLIIREAGGRVTDFEGRDVPMAAGPVVASNGVLHDWFLEVLNGASGGGSR